MNLKPGDLVLVKADAFKGRRNIKDRWGNEACQVVHQIMTDIPSYEVKNQHRKSHILHQIQLLLITSETGVPLCVGVHQEWDQCTSHTPVEPTPEGSDSKNMPQVDSGLVITQCWSSQTPLGWTNGKL